LDKLRHPQHVGQLRQPLTLRLDDGVSQQGACLGIVSVKIDDGIRGSLMVRTVFLDVGCVNDLQVWIAGERRRGRKLGPARATNAPGRFEHP
jgi:hypothetical protein